MKLTAWRWEQHRPWLRPLSLSVVLLGYSALAGAQITTDGSLGPGGPLAGPDYEITPDLGRQHGSNLFHSFGRFNLRTEESATFSGSDAIANVIGRVTGGESSHIDGTLRSSIPNADLWLINPAGMVFGENAELDVQGSFHASTADYIELEDGVQFNAVPSSADTLLTTAAPAAFGFLGAHPSPIEVRGALLAVPKGETLSLVGGDIEIRDGNLRAAGGRINLVSVASAGEIIVTAPEPPGVEDFEALGEIKLSRTKSPREAADTISGEPLADVDAGG